MNFFLKVLSRRRAGRVAAALNAQADVARSAGDFIAAADLYARMLAVEPLNDAIHIQCGHMNKEAGRLALAERHYLQARDLTPDDPDLQLQLGHFFKIAGRKAEAIAAYKEAERLSSGWQEPIDELVALGANGPGDKQNGAMVEQSTTANHALMPAAELAGRFQVASASMADASVVLPVEHGRPFNLNNTTDLPLRPGILFDEAFYLEGQPDLMPGQDAWAHFIVSGAAEGRNPHFLFSVGHYLLHSPEVAQSGENPLLHFLYKGRQEQRPFHWLFSPLEYKRLHPEIGMEDPLDHFLRYGLQENWQPHPLFEPRDYLNRYPSLRAANISAFEHFLKHGDAEGKMPHALFDPVYYAKNVNIPFGMPGFQHYMRFGRRENPHILFNGIFYLEQDTVIADSGINPLLHYFLIGVKEGRSPHPLFDVRYYLGQTVDPRAHANPLMHYVTLGAAQRLSPNSLFDPAYYQDRSARSWTGALLPRSGPRISILVPVYNTPPDILAACIESVRRQSYVSWELCLIDDCSTDHPTVERLEVYRGIDERIKIMRSPTNLHIARATNLVAEQATGDFIAFLDHDDTLEPQALAEIALAVLTRSDIDLLYTDEDKIDVAGNHTEPYHKPDWSPDHLWSVMYVLHFLVIRKSLFWCLGGLRAERSGAQDYDLALRAGAAARYVHHIPRILYHWRMIPGSAAAEVNAKPYALIAAHKALEDAVAASNAAATVEGGLLQGTFRVRYSLAERPAVTLIIFTNDAERDVPGRGRINMVRNFIRSIEEKSTYNNYQILVVDNDNASRETRKLVEEVGGQIISYRLEREFNYARKANFATRHVSTEHVIYLNDDLEVITPDWIESLLELSQQPTIGGVGARLLYPNNTLQHSGMVLGIYETVAHVFLNMPREHVGYNGYTHLIRNYSAVTGAVFATRLAVMNAVGGLDERLRVDYNDVDLCLRMGKRNFRIVFTPYCELYHFEGSTEIRTTQAPDETRLFHERWGHLIKQDPYYNPNLPRDRLNFV